MKIQSYSEKQLTQNFYKLWELVWSSQIDSHIFNSPYWFQTCLKIFKYKKIVIVVAKNDNGKISAIVPMVLDEKFGSMVYMSPGGKYLDKSTILFTNEINKKNIQVIFKYLSDNYDYFLSEIPAGYFKIISNANINFASSISSIGRDLYLDEHPLRNLSKENIRRLKKRIDDNKNLLIYKFNKYSINKSIQIAKIIEEKSNKLTDSKRIFTDENLINLCKELSKVKNIKIDFSFLFYEKNPICYKFGYICQNKYHYANSAYDLKYNKLSSGRLLMIGLIDYLKRKKINYIDLSRGETNFKKEFSNTPYTQYLVFHHKNYLLNIIWNLIYYIKPVIVKNEARLDYFFKYLKPVNLFNRFTK